LHERVGSLTVAHRRSGGRYSPAEARPVMRSL
jgi:hypothetical protein